MQQDDQRNFIIAMVLMIGFIWAYQTFIIEPEARARRAAQEAAAAQQAEEVTEGPEAGLTNPEFDISPTEALENFERIEFDAPAVDGSIRLRGALIDDLKLKRHFLTTEREAELQLLRPNVRDGFGYATTYGWELTADGRQFANQNTDWSLVEGELLDFGSPVVLEKVYSGLSVRRVISVDENYMFTFQDTISNLGAAPISVRPFGLVERHGDWKGFLEATDPGSAGQSGIIHQGLIGVLDGKLKLRKYSGLFKGRGIKGETTTDQGGWIGLTDKYWMTALVPQQDQTFDAEVDTQDQGGEPYLEVRTEGADYVIPAGDEITATNRIFAGAKELAVLQTYEADLGIPRMDDAVDWGMLYFLTKPFFSVLRWLEGNLGSFGLAILAFTVLIKIPLIPLYNTSFKAMAKMKKLTEPMKEIRERFKADPKRQQQEIMKLYQKEKANPLAGCLPILVTIPIFYSLFKTLSVTLEMRHESFLYLQDLSAPDPLAIGNLFGLLPWAASDVKAIPILGLVIGIGLLPLLYGITMGALQSLNPPPPDPTQRMVIMAMPIIFTFVFGGFAAGLVLYWVWNNVLTFGQQYFIMRRNGADTEIGKFVAKVFGRIKETAS